MSQRRTTFLAVVSVAGCVLVPAGAALLYLGSNQGHSGETVAGIAVLVIGLVCLRILFWVRRARLLTRAGLSFRDRAHQPGGSPHDSSD